MDKMTSYERISRMFEHKEADRVPIFDIPWRTTLDRWHNEGLPRDISYVDYFGLDKMVRIDVDNSPCYEACIIEETEEYKIYTTSWGVTEKDYKIYDATREHLSYTITDPDEWLAAKKRITPTKDRIPWEYLKNNYRRWRKEGCWVEALLWFGFDVTHSFVVGTERVLIALVENPEWIMDMFNHCLNVNLTLLDMVWDAGYTFDSVKWYDDMGYKQNQFFSVDMYRQILKPVHKRAIEWAHRKGVKAHLHSCGDINPFIPELIEIGLDALNPLEVKAGMNPIEIKKKFGNDLVLHGGLDILLWKKKEAIESAIMEILPVLKKSGGYIFSSDHSIPPTISLEDFRYIVELGKQAGRYD